MPVDAHGSRPAPSRARARPGSGRALGGPRRPDRPRDPIAHAPGDPRHGDPRHETGWRSRCRWCCGSRHSAAIWFASVLRSRRCRPCGRASPRRLVAFVYVEVPRNDEEFAQTGRYSRRSGTTRRSCAKTTGSSAQYSFNQITAVKQRSTLWVLGPLAMAVPVRASTVMLGC